MKASHLLTIAGAGLILTLPILIFGIPFLSDDGAKHAVWYVHFSEQLWSGDFYPRWLINMNAGLGSPAFFYYPPLPFFLTNLLKPFFTNDPHGWHQLGVSASLALIASGFSAYAWLKDMVDQNSALIAAILYMAMPYHLAADLYVRGSLSEYWTFVWIPIILLFTNKLINGHSRAAVGLAVSYALLIMTHLPTTLVFSVIPVCYALLAADTRGKARAIGITLSSMMLGIGLSAIYLLPAMLTQQYVFLDQMSTGYFSYENWFLFSKLLMWKEDKARIILLVLDMAGVACSAFVVGRRALETGFRKANAFWFTIAAASVFMMTELSKPVWTIFPVLKKIQFPWRFNVVLSVATAALLTVAISSLRARLIASINIAKMVALLLMVAWIPATVWAAWRSFPQTNPDRDSINYVKREIEQSRDVPEYWPRWNAAMAEINWETSTNEDYWDVQWERVFETLLQRVGKSEENQPDVSIVEGTGTAAVNARRPREIDLHVDTSTGVLLIVPQFYYPGWTAHLAGEKTNLTVSPSDPDGLLSVSVPRGDHQVQLRISRSKAEFAGQLISLASVIIALSLILYFRVF